MNKHTPGPWKTDPEAEHLCVLSRTGRLIADCAIFGTGDPEQVELEDNARLIAAAPELLEALKGVLRVAARSTVEFNAALNIIARIEGKS